MSLSAKKIASLKATEKRQEVPDGDGLYLIIQPAPSTARSWAFRYRSPTDPSRVKKFTIGDASTMSAPEARDAADVARKQMRNGIDPADASRIAKAFARDRSNVIDDCLNDYLQAYAKTHKASSHAEVERLFRVWVRPAIGRKKPEEVERRDIQQILAAMVKVAPISANRLLAALRPFFASIRIGGEPLPRLPTDSIEKPTSEKDRDRNRVLSDKEIGWLWRATDDASAFSGAVRMMLLTGQRRGEVAGLVTTELDLDAEPPAWLLPGARAKNGRENLIPLATEAVATIKRAAHVGRSKLVFTSTVGGELSGWNKLKAALDKRIFAIAAEDTGTRPNLEPWVLHDLRRTAATGMARMEVPPHVIEAVLNHKTGQITKLAGTYNRYAYAREKHESLSQWAKHLSSLGISLSRG